MRITLRVPAPAGPPPFGAPVETSIPFAQGKLKKTDKLAILSSSGEAMPAQMRPALRWPDGSIRWLQVIFEALDGAGEYCLTRGENPASPDLLQEAGGKVSLTTGQLQVTVPLQGESLWESLGAPQGDGSPISLLQEAPAIWY